MGSKPSKRATYQKVPIAKELILSPIIPSKFTKDVNGQCKINKGPYRDRELLELTYYLMPEYRGPIIFDKDTVNEFAKLLHKLLDDLKNLKCEHRNLRMLRIACFLSIIKQNSLILMKHFPKCGKIIHRNMLMLLMGSRDDIEFALLYMPLYKKDSGFIKNNDRGYEDFKTRFSRILRNSTINPADCWTIVISPKMGEVAYQSIVNFLLESTNEFEFDLVCMNSSKYVKYVEDVKDKGKELI